MVGKVLIAAPPIPSSADGEGSDLASVWLNPGSRTFRVIGEIDLSNSRRVLEALGRELDPQRDLVLDLTGLEFIDCSGLHVLEALAGRLENGGARLVLKSPRRIVHRALEVSRLSENPTFSIETGPVGPAGSPPGPDFIRLA